MPREDGYKNLIPMNKRTEEERRELSLRGGLANKARLEKKRTLNEIAKAILDKQVSKDKARCILGDYAEMVDDCTLGEILTIRQALEAQEGNGKAYEILRDTAGYKPTEKQEITAEIMTEADRALLELIAKRQGLTDGSGKTPQ